MDTTAHTIIPGAQPSPVAFFTDVHCKTCTCHLRGVKGLKPRLPADPDPDVSARLGPWQWALQSKRKDQRALEIRHAVAYVVRRDLGWSYPRIGDLMGKDHSTIMSNIRRFEKVTLRDPDPAKYYAMRDLVTDIELALAWRGECA